MDSSDFKGCSSLFAVITVALIIGGCFKRQEDERTINTMRSDYQDLQKRLASFETTVKTAKQKCSERLTWHVQGESMDLEMLELAVKDLGYSVDVLKSFANSQPNETKQRLLEDADEFQTKLGKVSAGIKRCQNTIRSMEKEVIGHIDSIPEFKSED